MRVPFQKAAFSALSTAVVMLAVSGGASAQILLTNANSGVALTQNFDSLSATATTTPFAPFTNNTTIAGLFAYQTATASTPTAYRSDNGGSGTGALYSYGATGVAERAFGSVASGTPGNFLYGFYFTNNGTTTINNFTVTYAGEQWRQGGNTATHQLIFDYRVFDSGVTGDTAVAATTGYTSVNALNFNSPVVAASGTTAATVDGNNAGRVSGITSTINAPIAMGQSVFVRYTDINDTGNDHGLAIDDFNFTANFAPADTPEPGTFALFALGAGPATGLIALRRRAARRNKA